MAIKIIKNEKLWMESEAIQQVEHFSKFEGVINAIGLPDLHSGKVPIGTTFQTKDVIYPFFIGNDIGCGMSLFDTKIKLKKFNMDTFTKKLEGTTIKGKYSIGGGNHFAELQSVEKIYHKELAKKINLNKQHLFLLVHSGSRNLGQQIYSQYASIDPLRKGTKAFHEYLEGHNYAVNEAKENRKQIAEIVMEYVGMKHDNECIVDCCHNLIEEHNGTYFHHKGSISTLHEYAIIAGSRGDYSYLVRCIPSDTTLYSISHGAGRKWPRHLCKGRLLNKYNKRELKSSHLGSRVITDKVELLYEEASEAYKNIEQVIEILLEVGVIELVARLKPLLTYKC